MPTWFIGGTRDIVIASRPGYVEAMDARLPNHRGTVLIDGAGHWTQQEAPEAFNEALLAAWRSWTAPAPRRLAERPHARRRASPRPGDLGRRRPVPSRL